MKKFHVPQKSRILFSALAILIFAICAVIAILALFLRSPENSRVQGGLEPGHYMNISGDVNHYILVYDDGTLEVFGLDYVKWSMENHHDGDFESENAQRFAQRFHDAMSSRNSFFRYRDSISVVTNDEFGYGITIVDEYTLMLADSDELVYVRKTN
jgi:hypothetical protein